MTQRAPAPLPLSGLAAVCLAAFGAFGCDDTPVFPLHDELDAAAPAEVGDAAVDAGSGPRDAGDGGGPDGGK